MIIVPDMKKILFILISITLFFLGSCTGEEKDIYDGNSNERLTEEEKACREDLQEAENGWIMEYFPNASRMEDISCLCRLTRRHGHVFCRESGEWRQYPERIGHVYIKT